MLQVGIRSFAEGFDAAEMRQWAFGDVSMGNEAQMADLLTAARKGRMDIAFNLAKPMLQGGETPSQFVARECSNRAARSWVEGRVERQAAIDYAVGGATFYLPLRGEVKANESLGTHFWAKKCAVQHEKAETVFRLCRASLSLRGIELGQTEAVDRLEQQCAAGDPSALRVASFAARDFQIMSQAVVAKLQTSRTVAVLQAFVAKAFVDDPNLPMRCGTLFRLMLTAGTHFTTAFVDTESDGPLEDPDGRHACPAWQKKVEDRQAGVLRQMRIISEITSEASTSMFADPKEGLALLAVAEAFFQEESPMAERRKAMIVFEGTSAKLRERIANSEQPKPAEESSAKNIINLLRNQVQSKKP